MPTLEDSLNLTAKLPAIAAFIYRLKYRPDCTSCPINPDLDWSGELCRDDGRGRSAATPS